MASWSGCTALNIPGLILEAAAQRDSMMFDGAFWVEQGALPATARLYDSGRQAARQVDKNLKGTQPAEIPVEVNPKIELSSM